MKKFLISASYLCLSLNAAHSVIFTDKLINRGRADLIFSISAEHLPYAQVIPIKFRENKSEQVDMQGFFDDIKQDLKEGTGLKAITLKSYAEIRGGYGTLCEPYIFITEKTNIEKLNNRKLVTVFGNAYEVTKCTVTDL